MRVSLEFRDQSESQDIVEGMQNKINQEKEHINKSRECVNSKKGNIRIILYPTHLFLLAASSLVGDDNASSTQQYSSRQLDSS